MTWFDLAYASLTAAGIVLIPGLALAMTLGLRGLWAWGMAGPFGITVIALASLVAPMLGVAWGIWAVLGVFVIIAAGLGAVRALLRGRARRPARVARPATRWAPVVSLVVAALLIGAQVVQTIQAPGNISQTFDNIFHLNGIRFALDTGDASPLHLGRLTSPSGGQWFYPSAWHALGSLVLQITGVDVAVVANALALFVSAVLWPAGIVLLACTIFGASRALMLSAGVFAAALPSMPLLMMNYGVLYPFQLALAITPSAVSAVLVLLRVADRASPGATWIWIIVMLGALPGMIIAHPGAFMAWIVFSSIAASIAFVRYVRSAPGGRRVTAASTAFAGYAVIVLVAWKVLKPPVDARSWQPTLTLGQSIGEVMTLSYWGAGIPIVAAVAAAIGVVASIRRRTSADAWILLGLIAVSTLYIASVGMPWPTLRDLLTASWYNNAPRLAAIAPIVLAPLAARGAAAVWSRGRAWLETTDPSASARHLVEISGAALFLAVVVGTQVGAVPQAVHEASLTYSLTADSALVSDDEMVLLRRLAEEVPEDAVIAGSPWTGTALAYGISGRRVLMPHTLMEIDDDTAVINDRLDVADRLPAVCDALREKGVEFVLDFGSREVHGAMHTFPGLIDLDTSDAVQLADSEGAAKLYRITACRAD